MFQFLLNLIQAYYDIKINAPYPQWLIKVCLFLIIFIIFNECENLSDSVLSFCRCVQILFYYMISLLFLFGNFYVQKYIKPSSSRKEKGAKTE